MGPSEGNTSPLLDVCVDPQSGELFLEELSACNLIAQYSRYPKYGSVLGNIQYGDQ